MSITTMIETAGVIASLAWEPDTTKIEQPKMEYYASNLEILETGDSKTNKARLNLFYNLPGNTKVYSFIEMDGKGYFAKTMGYVPLNRKGTGAKAELLNSNSFKDNLGIGIEQRFSINGTNVEVKALPLWVDLAGYKKDRMIVGAFISKQWPINFLNRDFKVEVSAFGEVNVAAKERGQWDYGEANAQVQIPTKVGQFDVGAGYNFYNKGTLVPDAVFRAKIGYHIKK